MLIQSSCKKYLDIKTNSNQGVAFTAKDCQFLLDDYTTMNSGYPSDGELSADDYYLTLSGYQDPSLNQEDRDIHIWAPAAIRGSASITWVNTYKVVFNANLVLETLNKLKGGNTDQTTMNTLRGSALFYKAYAFWNVAQIYTKPYSAATAGQDPGIPLRKTTDINEKSDRGTIQQTYDTIILELQEAVNLLPVTSSVATRPNKVAAYAMLARVYLSMEDYANALTNANSALQLNSQLIDYNTISKTSTTPFSPRFNKEVIFHSYTRRTPALQPGSSSFPLARIDDALAASYAANDLRSNIFFKKNSDGTFRFTGNYEPVASFADLFTGLAVDELFLIRAECYARSGNKDAALADLNTLLVTRWNNTIPYVNITATTANEALTKILAERRKELLMRGLRWSDLRRLNNDPRFKKDLTRVIKDTGGSIQVSATLPANDSRYTLLIPQEVINNSGIAQNIR